MAKDQHSRLKSRNKKRKANLVLNSSIAVVLGLIVIVGSIIFFNNDKTNIGSSDNDDEQTLAEQHLASLEPDEALEGKDSDGEEANSLTDNEVDKEEREAQEAANDSATGEDESVNGSWEPIGTTQTGEHVSSYDENSVDWEEKVKAISYATGIEESNMLILFIGNHENSPHKSVGTVSSFDDLDTEYKVYLEWVDQKGWKPVKVEKN
ncbi:YrrS family protein [Jeotgalibacillus marinus]|uniref:YrrS family protein n=1 Tax=Jeotgalibacillus marinus TaxID=86667 RepID=A0ABV3Q129_9BACL